MELRLGTESWLLVEVEVSVKLGLVTSLTRPAIDPVFITQVIHLEYQTRAATEMWVMPVSHGLVAALLAANLMTVLTMSRFHYIIQHLVAAVEAAHRQEEGLYAAYRLHLA
jgi:hypothetical protein